MFSFLDITYLRVISTGLRRRLQLFITRHFYRHKYEFRDKWMETIEKIGLSNDLSQIEDSLIEMISETMAVREVFLWIYEPVHREYTLVKSTISKVSQIRLKEDHPPILKTKDCAAPFYVNETEKIPLNPPFSKGENRFPSLDRDGKEDNRFPPLEKGGEGGFES